MCVLLNLVANLLKLGNLKGNSAATAMGMYLLSHTHFCGNGSGSRYQIPKCLPPMKRTSRVDRKSTTRVQNSGAWSFKDIKNKRHCQCCPQRLGLPPWLLPSFPRASWLYLHPGCSWQQAKHQYLFCRMLTASRSHLLPPLDVKKAGKAPLQFSKFFC